MMTYQETLETTTYLQDNNFNHGIRQLEWAANWLAKPASEPLLANQISSLCRQASEFVFPCVCCAEPNLGDPEALLLSMILSS